MKPSMIAKDEVIAMWKEKLARQNIEGNDRANQAENKKTKIRREAKAKR